MGGLHANKLEIGGALLPADAGLHVNKLGGAYGASWFVNGRPINLIVLMP